MYLELVSGRGGSPVAKYFTRDLEKALAAADKLKAAGLRPNVVRSGPNYVVYIDTAELLRLAEKNDEIRRAVALYLAEKAKNGTPRQREIAENPTNALLNPWLAAPLKPIIIPSHRIKSTHATGDLRQNAIEEAGMVGPEGFEPPPYGSGAPAPCSL